MGVSEPTLNITGPLVLLALGSIFVGYLGKELVLSNVMSPIVINSVKIIPLFFSLFGGVLAFVVYFYYRQSYYSHSVYTFFNSA